MAPTTGLQDVSTRAGGSEVRPTPACGHHHGRQRPLGEAAQPAARPGPSRRRQRPEARPSKAAAELGRRACMTVFGFSTENWSRPPQRSVGTDGPAQGLSRIRSRAPGPRGREGADHRPPHGPAADVLDVIDRAERRTSHNSDFLLQVAFNYGGRADIADAARAFALARGAWRGPRRRPGRGGVRTIPVHRRRAGRRT